MDANTAVAALTGGARLDLLEPPFTVLEFSLDLRGLGQRSSIIGSGAGFFSTVTTSGTPLDVTEGSASYFDVVTADGVIRDAAWTYEEP